MLREKNEFLIVQPTLAFLVDATGAFLFRIVRREQPKDLAAQTRVWGWNEQRSKRGMVDAQLVRSLESQSLACVANGWK